MFVPHPRVCVCECLSASPAVHRLSGEGEHKRKERQEVKGEERQMGINSFSVNFYLLLTLSGECVCLPCSISVCVWGKGLNAAETLLPCNGMCREKELKVPAWLSIVFRLRPKRLLNYGQ